LTPLSTVYVNNQLFEPRKSEGESTSKYSIQKKNMINLSHLSQIYFPCESCITPHLYYFILPKKKPEGEEIKRGSIFTPTRISC